MSSPSPIMLHQQPHSLLSTMNHSPQLISGCHQQPLLHHLLSSTSPKSSSISPVSSASSPLYHFKILVPAAAAGRIIGRGGHTIAQLQREAGARVKMSKPSEFYPGTTERVCLVSGPIDGILKINDFFLDSLSSTSIKILVPNSAAGIIIGKAGQCIKQIKEESGAFVQISQKCTDLSSAERCVTIMGGKENIRKACAIILAKIFDSTTGSLTTMSDESSSSSSLIFDHNPTSSLTFGSSPSPGVTTIGAIDTPPINDNNLNANHIMESILLVLRVSGYSDKAINEITDAMSTLAKYGVLGAGLGLL